MVKGRLTWYSFICARDRSVDSSQLEVAFATYVSWRRAILSLARPSAEGSQNESFVPILQIEARTQQAIAKLGVGLEILAMADHCSS